jgi:type VI secretion system secreted protein VgrG
MREITIRLVAEALGDAVVLAVDGVEAMDALSSWTVRVSVAEPLDVSALLRAPVKLVFDDLAEESERQVALLVTGITREIARGRDRVYTLELSDLPWLLTRRGGYRVFLEKTTEQIVTQVLVDAGIPAQAIEPRIGGAYPVRLQCVQYAEAEWAFVERLLADDGISYWFETTEAGEHRILFGDATGSHAGIEVGTTVPYTGPTGVRPPGARVFFALEWEESVVTERAIVRDFDVRQPSMYLDGHAGEGDLVHFEYPAGVESAAAAQARAQRRLEQLQRDGVSVSGESDCARLAPGRLVDITGAGAELFEQRMLITEVRHRFAKPLRDGGESVPYSNRVVLKPTRGSSGAERAPHRPAIRRAPTLEHLESALVTGPGSEEIHVDDLGRIKVRFLWDRSGIKDDKSSRWIRCLQYPLGASMFLPRVGWEVSIGYLDGSADRPFVLGRLYNATAVTPYALPRASATTSFQSWTTPRSGMTQEIKMVDDAGSQEFFVHASKDFSIKVGGTLETKVDGDQEHSIGLSHTSNVLGDESTIVAAYQSLDVGQELLLSVGGENSEIIGGAEIINVTGNRAVNAAGSCTEIVGVSYNLLCNQSNVQVSGACTRVVGGSTLIAAGAGMSESVAGGRVYACLGSRIINCTGYTESIYGYKRSSAGAVVEKGVAFKLESPSGTIKVGSAAITAGGAVSIKGAVVTVDVSGNLNAGTLKLGGGTFSTSGGATVIDGATSRPSGATVGS